MSNIMHVISAINWAMSWAGPETAAAAPSQGVKDRQRAPRARLLWLRANNSNSDLDRCFVCAQSGGANVDVCNLTPSARKCDDDSFGWPMQTKNAQHIRITHSTFNDAFSLPPGFPLDSAHSQPKPMSLITILSHSSICRPDICLIINIQWGGSSRAVGLIHGSMVAFTSIICQQHCPPQNKE